MARYRGSVCKLCRREKIKLFLKGERCFSPKCPVEKQAAVSKGRKQVRIRTRTRTRLSEYGMQLKEKQRARLMTGVLEKQFRKYFRKAEREKGLPGENLLRLLECRLDNIVFRLGFASSRNQARQLVRHRHTRVNGRCVDIPSYQVRVGDRISLDEKSKQLEIVKVAQEKAKERGLPAWIEFDQSTSTGRILELPKREEISIPVQEQLIVELYSK
ncbi:30S ribosomal protein S4 [bacterium]|nr:30S ribosomal protein S4 [bacterium]